MPGTALVTINENQWSVNVASTTTELTTGLSGVASLVAGTGMLFVLPARQLVTVQTNEMLFPIDIIFIKDGLVLDIASNIQPGFLVEEATPIDMFLEVNALEAVLVEVGDAVNVEIITTQAPGFDWSQFASFAIPLAILGLVSAYIGGMFRPAKKSSSKQIKGSNPKEYYWGIADIDTGEIMQKDKPYTTSGKALAGARSFQKGRYWAKENLVIIRIYDDLNMDEWGKTIRPVIESGMRRGIPIEIGKTPLQKAALDRLWPYGIKEIHSDGDLTVFSQGKKYVVTTEGGVFREEDIIRLSGEMIEIPLKPSEERYSIHGEPRRRLVEQYGSWAVGRAEAVCAEDDVACVEREAKRLIETIRTRYGEEAMAYIRITNPGKSVFHINDTVSLVAFERENKRLRSINEKEAIGEAVV